MVSPKVLLLTSIMAPYRIELFNTLADDESLDLEVVYLARTEPNRRWAVREDEMRFRHQTLRENWRSRRGESFTHFNFGLAKVLREARPDVLVVGGWDQPAFLEAFALRRRVAQAFVWWVESNLRDRRQNSEAFRIVKHRSYGRPTRSSFPAVLPPSTSGHSVLRYLVVASHRTLWTTTITRPT